MITYKNSHNILFAVFPKNIGKKENTTSYWQESRIVNFWVYKTQILD